MTRKGTSLLAGFLIGTLLFCSLSYAQSAQMTKGLNYLFSTQNPDGSWTGTVNRGPFSTTVNVMETLSMVGQGGTPAYSNAVSWLQTQNLNITEQLSDRIYVLSAAGADRDLLISYIDSEEGAWGGYEDYDVNNLDTALSIRALMKISFQDQTLLNAAVNFMLSSQNADGGWGLKPGMDSELYYTTFISKILQQLPQTPAITASIERAYAYRSASQNPGT
jgi:prenyltransferase beta subunit